MVEFVPLDVTDALLTPTETTQSTLAALEHWAANLDDVYVQGAFRRAAIASAAPLPLRLVAARYEPTPAVASPGAIADPFAAVERGADVLRADLNVLSRPTLLQIIDRFGLNPARKNLAWLTNRQLVTFIVTAVEAQAALSRRSP